MCLTLPPVQPSFCVSPPHSLSEVLFSPVFILRRFLLDPFLVFPSLPVRDHPHSPRSDCNFSSVALSPVLVFDEESCCLQSTQDFDIVIQFMTFSLSFLHIQSIPHDHYRLVCRRLVAPTRWRSYLTKEGRCCDTCSSPDLFRSMNLL